MTKQKMILIGLMVLGLMPLISCRQQTKPSKGVIVLVHGAWGGGWGFRQMEELLQAKGYQVYRPTLTGQGERVHLAGEQISLETHIQDIVNVILYEDLKGIVLLGHSYGGMVITGIADRIPERISRLIYLDAVLPEDGENLLDHPAFAANKAQLLAAARGGFIYPMWVKEDQNPPKDVPHPLKTLTDPIVLNNPKRLEIPADYILTIDPGTAEQLDTFYPYAQRAAGYEWPVHRMEADHNPQRSKPKELAELLDQILQSRPVKRPRPS
ncbi:MAG TPA: alpha/beta hydrolase [Anaerohalosphaeraceae bacterium]|nr:alpha/beta hydrolase [Anaerohalosphaeraceae bacterium]HOL88384.1 alpha/beta hydrolase [Anaerohalosphaeraceae bacterium]HPP55036.1 alpha/beta hydrolase [Anaerohalosphaeraceae bacterium]